MLLQPQALAQHFLHGIPDRVHAVPGDGFEFGPGGAQPGLELVGGVQQVADRALAAPNEPAEGERDRNGGDGDQAGHQQQKGGSHAAIRRKYRASLPRPGGCGKLRPECVATPPIALGNRCGSRGSGLTHCGPGPTIPRLMSADLPAVRLPEVLDAWRMVAAGRRFEGVLPLAGMLRLKDSLVDTDGMARVAVEFGRDALRVPYVEVGIEAELPLQCQRSLQRFLLPVRMVQRLGLVASEADEAALPPDYEALVVPEDGGLRPAELVEDELILAVPVVPVAPGTEAMERDWPASADEAAAASPFAALAALKPKK